MTEGAKDPHIGKDKVVSNEGGLSAAQRCFKLLKQQNAHAPTLNLSKWTEIQKVSFH